MEVHILHLIHVERIFLLQLTETLLMLFFPLLLLCFVCFSSVLGIKFILFDELLFSLPIFLGLTGYPCLKLCNFSLMLGLHL